MLIAGTAIVSLVILGGISSRRYRMRATVLAFVAALIALLAPAGTAGAAVVPTVPLGTASTFAVLGASTVTNTNGTTLDGDLGLSPGPDIVGFPPGEVLAPWTIYENTAEAASAQAALDTAYLNAQGRPVDNAVTAELSGQVIIPGVTAGPNKGALLNSGTLVFDGQGLTDPVFIVQAFALTTATGSTMALINGADACNIFWQVESSATLGVGSTFQGTVMADASVSVLSGATVHGRALARTAAVTLDDDTFTSSACTADEPTTTTTTEATTTADTVAPTSDATSVPGSSTTAPASSSTTPTPSTPSPASTVPGGGTGPGPDRPGVPGGPGAPGGPGGPGDSGGPGGPAGPGGPGVPGVSGPPRTGAAPAPDQAPERPGHRGATALFGGIGCVGLALTARGRRDRTGLGALSPR